MPNTDNNVNAGIGMGFTSLLTIVFIVLKLTNYIDWSWWWVTSPLWIPVATGIAIGVIVGFIMGIIQAIKSIE